MRTTRYFEERVLGHKRPYLKLEWVESVLANPIERRVQEDGRVRLWGQIPDAGDRVLRVVTLADGTVHNAFFDRRYKI